MALRRQLGQFGLESALGIEQLLRSVALHPFFEDLDMLGLVHVAHRHLMRAPVVLALFPIDFGRAGPALWRAEDDHRPGRPLGSAVGSSIGPNLLDFCQSQVEDPGQLLVDGLRITSLDKVRLVAHPLEELLQFVLGNAGQEAGVGDLVSVQMEDRKHAAVTDRIEKLVAVPTGCQWARFRLAIADDAGYDQVRVIERGSVSMAERVAEFATFVDRAWCFWGNVRGDAAGEAELLEQLSHPL